MKMTSMWGSRCRWEQSAQKKQRADGERRSDHHGGPYLEDLRATLARLCGDSGPLSQIEESYFFLASFAFFFSLALSAGFFLVSLVPLFLPAISFSLSVRFEAQRESSVRRTQARRNGEAQGRLRPTNLPARRPCR